jgi:hypothetical protein
VSPEGFQYETRWLTTHFTPICYALLADLVMSIVIMQCNMFVSVRKMSHIPPWQTGTI